MSLAEIKSAVDALSPEELAELAAFIRERDNAAWDRQIDVDFAGGVPPELARLGFEPVVSAGYAVAERDFWFPA